MRSLVRWRLQPTTGAATKTRGRAPAAPESLSHPNGMPEAEWHALIASRPNLLLEGTPPALDRVLRALHPHLAEPVFCWRAAAQLSLPQHHRGSLLLYGVAAMRAEEQASVLDWLDQSRGRVQVVSISTRPLFGLVARGEFRSDLFYRLSVLRVRVTASAAPA